MSGARLVAYCCIPQQTEDLESLSVKITKSIDLNHCSGLMPL